MTSIDRWEVKFLSRSPEKSPGAAIELAEAIFSIVQKTVVSLHICVTQQGVSYRIWATTHENVTRETLNAVIDNYYDAVIYPLRIFQTFPFFRKMVIFSRDSTGPYEEFPAFTSDNNYALHALFKNVSHELEKNEQVNFQLTIDGIRRLSDEIIREELTSPQSRRYRTQNQGKKIAFLDKLRSEANLVQRYPTYDVSQTRAFISKLRSPLAVVTANCTFQTLKKHRFILLEHLVNELCKYSKASSANGLSAGIIKTYHINNDVASSEFTAGGLLSRMYRKYNYSTMPYTLFLQPEELAFLWNLPASVE